MQLSFSYQDCKHKVSQVVFQGIISTIFDFDMILAEQRILEILGPVLAQIAKVLLHHGNLDLERLSHMFDMKSSEFAENKTVIRSVFLC